MSTINYGDKAIEVRIAPEKKTGRTLWMAYLVSKPSGEEMRLCTRDNRKDCLAFVDRFVAPK
jgi:hypothetical protein